MGAETLTPFRSGRHTVDLRAGVLEQRGDEMPCVIIIFDNKHANVVQPRCASEPAARPYIEPICCRKEAPP